ncbi:MAG: hypothetical protein ABSA53_26305 [Streptosporangiaceae bacterium]|jgi:dihydrofolate reductase
MRKLIETTHVALGGDIGSPQDWALPYLDDEHMRYVTELVTGAHALLLGRRTYQGFPPPTRPWPRTRSSTG